MTSQQRNADITTSQAPNDTMSSSDRPPTQPNTASANQNK